MQRNNNNGDRNEEDHVMVNLAENEVSERWVALENGKLIPAEPIQPYFLPGRINGNFHYIARYMTDDFLSPIGSFVGPLVRTQGLLRVPGEIGNLNGPLTRDYEVLVVSANAVRWVPINRNQTLPENARTVPTGITKNEMSVFIGKRVDVGVGMVYGDANYCLKFYSSASAHAYDADFEVLCFN